MNTDPVRPLTPIEMAFAALLLWGVATSPLGRST